MVFLYQFIHCYSTMLNIDRGVHQTILLTSTVFISTCILLLPSSALAAQTHASIDLQQMHDTTDIMKPHVRISISTEDTAINAAEVLLGFDSDALEIDHIEGATSDFHIEIPTEVRGDTVDIVRGNTTALQQGTHEFIDIYFARTKKRRAYINLLPSSAVTASDGEGTNVFDGQLGKLLL